MARNEQLSTPGKINMVGEGTVVEGTLHAESDIRVSGKILGTLRVDGKAIIAKEGAIEGELEAVDADVAGSVQGEVRVSQRLVLQSSSHVDGSIATERLVVEEGAVFSGKCEMGEAAVQPSSPSSRRNGNAGNAGKSKTADDSAIDMDKLGATNKVSSNAKSGSAQASSGGEQDEKAPAAKKSQS